MDWLRLLFSSEPVFDLFSLVLTYFYTFKRVLKDNIKISRYQATSLQAITCTILFYDIYVSFRNINVHTFYYRESTTLKLIIQYLYSFQVSVLMYQIIKRLNIFLLCWITSALNEIYDPNRFNTLNTSKSKKRCITSKYGTQFSIKWNLNDQIVYKYKFMYNGIVWLCRKNKKNISYKNHDNHSFGLQSFDNITVQAGFRFIITFFLCVAL